MQKGLSLEKQRRQDRRNLRRRRRKQQFSNRKGKDGHSPLFPGEGFSLNINEVG